MLIKNSRERATRHHEKMMSVLRYLAREHYSDFATLKRLFGFKNHRGMYDLLNKLVSTGAIKKEPDIYSSTLWRITAAGCAQAYPECSPPHREFLSLSSHTLRQHIAVQNARLSFEALGVHNWIDGKNAPFPTRRKHRPSGVFTWHDGSRYAVEVITRLKTPLRYREIMKTHLLSRTDEEWLYVYVVAPNEQAKLALTTIFNETKILRFSGRKITLEAKHHGVFKFITQGELSTKLTAKEE